MLTRLVRIQLVVFTIASIVAVTGWSSATYKHPQCWASAAS